jgi:N6-L-threonylcarbamoyladenine synthase
MNILAIETSCDETSAAVVSNGREVLSNVVASQAAIHSQYGGVVPEVAARQHIESIIPVIDEAKKIAGVDWSQIDALAVVQGAGLLPSLLSGVATAKSLALALGKPLVPVNHIIGHIYANWIGRDSDAIEFPALALIVSGGHTDLYIMSGHLRFKHLGGTLDDAAGEAFDKVASLLGLGYPGGPEISKRAEMGDSQAFAFPRSLMTTANFNFSFSGLKTSVINQVRKLEKSAGGEAGQLSENQINDISASFEQAVVDSLVTKTIRAAEKYRVPSLLLAGGVAANKNLRATLSSQAAAVLPKTSYYQPDLSYCLDNAAMAGVAASYLWSAAPTKFSNWAAVEALSDLKIESN